MASGLTAGKPLRRPAVRVRHVLLPHVPRTPAEPAARAWLAGQWRMPAADLPLRRDARGRPGFAAPLEHADASWSHSGGSLLVACGERLRIGCDLERIRPRRNAALLAERFFHPEEARWLGGLPADRVEHAFLRLWCAKEAILKCHGHGLAFGLDRMRLVERDGRLHLHECDPRLGRPGDWRLEELVPAEGHLAAIAWHPLPVPWAGAAIL